MNGPKRYRALVTGEAQPTVARQLSAKDEAALLLRHANAADGKRLEAAVAKASREALLIARFELQSLGYSDLVMNRLHEIEETGA